MSDSTQIRTLTLSLLAAALPTYTAYDSPIGQWNAAELPALSVSTTGHQESNGSIGSVAAWNRREVLTIEIATKSVGADNPTAEAAIAALLDTVCDLVDSTLEQSPEWRQKCHPESKDVSKSRSAEGEYRWGTLTVRYTFSRRHMTRVVSPDELEAIHAQLDLINPGNGPDGTVEGEVRVDPREES